jgi:hypothetical protein
MNRQIGRFYRGAPWVTLLLALAIAGGLCPSGARAQEASLQGVLLDEATSEPLNGVEVVLELDGQAVRSTVTNRNGLYQISRIPPGVYVLRMSLLGYATHEETMELESGEARTASRGLKVAPVELQGVASGRDGPGAVRRELGGQTILAAQLAQIPTPAATGDVMSFLQMQPGVVGSGDRGGQLFIRGGTASENLVLMDGMLIYQPFHITGLFSAFPEELIQSAEFFPGGFGPRYTGRISSVLDVQMRDGNRKEGSVMASASPFLAAAAAEGPVGSEGRNSYIVSARRSLIGETSPWLLGEKQPLHFTSGYVRLSHLNPNGSSRCSLTLRHSRDEGGLDPEDRRSRVGWTNVLMGGRCTTLVGVAFMDVRFGRTAVSSEAVTRGASEFASSASRIFLEADVDQMIGRVGLDWGGHVHVEHTRYDLQELLAADSKGAENWPAAGVYAELDVPVAGGLRLLPGVAASIAYDGHPSIEPRLRASWRMDGRVDGELHGAVGIYEQRLSGISDRRDASSIFTAWVRTPHGSRMRSIHAQASWEQSLGPWFSYSVDGYYRRSYDLTVATWSTAARFTPELSLAGGRSRGADVRVEFRRGPVYLFGGYALGWTEYHSAQDDFQEWFGEPVQTYNPPHDRRHQANAIASLELGRFTVAARWEYGSGFPYTRPIGFDEVIDFRTERNPLRHVNRTFGETRLLLDRPYNGRLPPTHRLDVSARRTVALGSRDLELQAGVINVYDQTNMFYYDVFADRRIDQLPLTPYLSVKLQSPGAARP